MEELDLSAFGIKSSEFDLNSLLNDKDLLKDLHSLGWAEPGSQQQTVPTNTNSYGTAQGKSSANQPALPQAPLLDISHLVQDVDVDIDEENLQNDDDLLQEYAALSGGGVPPSASAANTTRINAPPVSQVQPAQVSAPPTRTQSAAPPTINNNSIATSTPNPMNVTSAEEAKRLACKFKRDGNTDEALKWFRHAKMLEQQQSTQQTAKKPTTAPPTTITTSTPTATAPTTTTASTPVPAPGSVEAIRQQFTNLETALTEASNIALNQAKAMKAHGDNKMAIEYMKEYKKYEQELSVLRTRILLPGSTAPLFQWQTIQKQEKIEHLDIGENDMKVDISCIHGLESVLENHSSRNLSLRITFGSGGSDDSTANTLSITTPQYKYNNETKSVQCSFTTILPSIVKRGKVGQTSFLRKKIIIDIILHRGLFRSDIIIAQCIIPFNELNEKCLYHNNKISIYSYDEKNDTKKLNKSSAIGGWLDGGITIRTPIMKPEIKIIEERKLLIQPWPELMVVKPSQSTTTTSMTSTIAQGSSVVLKQSDVVPSNVSVPIAAAVAPTTKVNNAFADLTDIEKSDPESLDFYISNDVMTAEITKLESLVTSGQQQGIDDLELIQLNTRLQMLQIKLQILEQKVISEELSMEQYLEMIKERLKRDQQIALYFKSLNTKESIALAVNVMKRIKIMKEEIANAEAAMADDNDA